MLKETYSETLGKENWCESLTHRIKNNLMWWMMCLLAVIAVFVADMTTLMKTGWVIVLLLMAYWAPTVSEYIDRKMYSE